MMRPTVHDNLCKRMGRENAGGDCGACDVQSVRLTDHMTGGFDSCRITTAYREHPEEFSSQIVVPSGLREEYAVLLQARCPVMLSHCLMRVHRQLAAERAALTKILKRHSHYRRARTVIPDKLIELIRTGVNLLFLAGIPPEHEIVDEIQSHLRSMTVLDQIRSEIAAAIRKEDGIE